MNHYSKEEWTIYAKNIVDENIEQDMEKHLLSCTQCLNSYIEAVEAIEEVKNYISVEFTDGVMEKIDNKYYRNKTSSKRTKSILIYYTAAACITLLLMGSGVFNMMLKTFPGATAEIIYSPGKIESALKNYNPYNYIVKNLKFKDIFKTKQ